MADSRYLKDRYTVIISVKYLGFWWNFVYLSSLGQFKIMTEIQNFKSKMTDARHIWKRHFGHNSTADFPILAKFVRLRNIGRTVGPDVWIPKNSNFENVTAILKIAIRLYFSEIYFYFDDICML